jgi:UDP-N-acetylglucosamine/UDP-N-acetylgalactosamine diphosphorylase
MTSDINHAETAEYFEEMKYFGLNSKDVLIFSQEMIPSLDASGKLILSSKCTLFKNPDGHGGSLTILKKSGALDEIQKRGIETISYFQVDNPLVKIIDPVFIGFHVLNDAEISSKAVAKSSAAEKVGVFVEFSNKNLGVIEYSDLPQEKAQLTDDHGKLKFISGSIAIHLFSTGFIEKITSGGEIALPYHTAKKKIFSYAGDVIKEIDGLKFEKFVFDALPLTDKNNIFETLREDEFAPVKNASGEDSVESAQKLMNNLYKKWLISKGVKIPVSVQSIELTANTAVDPDDINSNLVLPDKKEILI